MWIKLAVSPNDTWHNGAAYPVDWHADAALELIVPSGEEFELQAQHLSLSIPVPAGDADAPGGKKGEKPDSLWARFLYTLATNKRWPYVFLAPLRLYKHIGGPGQRRYMKATRKVYRDALRAIGVAYKGSPLWWIDLDRGPVRAATLYDFAQPEKRVQPPSGPGGEGLMWLMTLEQWDTAQYPPESQGGPPYIKGVSVARQKKAAKKQSAEKNFENEDDVVIEMARALETEPDELAVHPGNRYGTYDGSHGTVWHITEGGLRGGDAEYFVVQDSDVADAYAKEQVEEQLREDPSMFTKSFIEQHLDEEKLKREVAKMIEESQQEYVNDTADHELWDLAESVGMYVPEEDDDGDRRDLTDEEKETLVEKLVERDADQPLAYLKDLYGADDAMKKAVEIAGIDYASAAEAAVRDDGAGHYLSSYDGETRETPRERWVYWRTQ